MGLLKRLVVAIEKIADRKDDYSELGILLNNAMRVQTDGQMKLRMIERKENMRDRYNWLKSKKKQGKPMEDSELLELEFGKEMFESDVEKRLNFFLARVMRWVDFRHLATYRSSVAEVGYFGIQKLKICTMQNR